MNINDCKEFSRRINEANPMCNLSNNTCQSQLFIDDILLFTKKYQNMSRPKQSKIISMRGDLISLCRKFNAMENGYGI